MARNVMVLALVIDWICTTCGYRVLMIPALGGGHLTPFAGLAEELAKQGHQVFTLAVIDERIRLPEALNVPPNRTIVAYKITDPEIWKYNPEKVLGKVVSEGVGIRELMTNVKMFTRILTKTLLLENEELFGKMEKLKFDFAIVDDMFGMRFFYLIPHRLKIPTVSVIHMVDPFYLRIPHLPSFVPSPLLPYSDKMTFLERLQNLIATVGFYVVPLNSALPEDIKEKYSGYGTFNSEEDLGRKSLLWLHVVHPVLDFPSPSVPSVVKVGGIASSNTVQPLENPFKDFTIGSTKGVIIMSFGSAISKLPSDTAKKFVDVFSRLEERVIWRYENVDGLDIPDNVLISSWIPQKDLLAHTNVKVFISHGGSGGQHEALTYGVPMLVFPLFGDQFYNAARSKKRGYSETMNIHTFTPNELFNNLRILLDDPDYKERTTEAAQIMNEQVSSPAELSVHWIDHVMKHGGYLRHRALDMEVFEVLMLDLFAFLTFSLTVSTIFVYCCVRYLIRKCCKVKRD